MVTLEKNIAREDYNIIANDIYTAFFTSAQLVEEYTNWLKTAMVKGVFQTKEQKAHVIKFLAKLNTQKELLELSQNTEALQATQNAAATFTVKTKQNA